MGSDTGADSESIRSTQPFSGNKSAARFGWQSLSDSSKTRKRQLQHLAWLLRWYPENGHCPQRIKNKI